MLFAGIVLACAVALTGASAQTGRERVGTPIPLRPGAANQDKATTPDSSTVDKERASPLRRRPVAPRIRGQSDVRIGELKAFDPSSIGLLTDAEGGLGIDMWQGSELSRIKKMLPRLPMGTTSPVMQSLARRLLLTVAHAPKEDGQGTSLLAIRIERLAAGGHLSDLNDLLQQAPAGVSDEALAQVQMNGMWLEDKKPEACALALNWVTRSEAPAWQKSAAFCHALDGDAASVEVYEQLLSESEHKDDAFFAMIAALLGRGGKPLKSLPNVTPLQMAMLRAAKWALPQDALDTAGPLVLRGIVDSPVVSLSTRLEAAERAVEIGALTVEALQRLYANVTFTKQMRDQPLEIAVKEPGARSNALLFQLARTTRQPIERAKLLDAALTAARTSGRYTTIARVNLEALQTLAPVTGLDWFSAEAGRALLAAGDVERALTWLIAANQSESADGEVAAQNLWPLLLIADDGERVPFDAKQFLAWWESQGEFPAETRVGRAGLFLTLASVLGRQVPPAAWDVLYGEAGFSEEATPSPALRHGLRQAIDGKRKGEAVLWALLNLGSGGPATSEPGTLALVIWTLQGLELQRDARALGLEALLAQDF